MADSTDSSQAAPSKGMTRVSSMPVIEDISAAAPRPHRERLSTLDIGWLKRSTKRFRLESTHEVTPPTSPALSRASSIASEDQNASHGGLIGSVSSATPKIEDNQRLGISRKSESGLWKWLNTPMHGDGKIKGLFNEEKDAQQLQNTKAVQDERANIPAIVINKGLKSSLKDLNVLSPSQW